MNATYEIESVIDQSQADGSTLSFVVRTSLADYPELLADRDLTNPETAELVDASLRLIHRELERLHSLPASHRSRAKALLLAEVPNPACAAVAIHKAIRRTA